MRASLITVTAFFVACAPAGADIVVTETSRDAARPGHEVRVSIGCGGCPRAGLDLPVSLVPVARGGPHPCRRTSCDWAARELPTKPPYVPLGTSQTDVGTGLNHLTYEVPDIRPGLYTYVIFCEPCYRGPEGSLIGHPTAWRPAVLADGSKRLGAWSYLRVRRSAEEQLDRVVQALLLLATAFDRR